MATDKTQTQDRELVGYKQQSNSGNDTTFFPQLNRKLQAGRLSDQRDTRPRADREQMTHKQISSLSWLTDHRFIDQNLRTELSLQKKKEKPRFTFKSAKILHNHFCKKEKTIS